MIRYVIFWVGAKEELPPEVLRMDGETVRVTGQIYKREQREKGPTWYLRSEDRGYIVYSSTWSGYKIGNTITVTGTFQLFERPSNPGAFDSRSYYLNQKICGRILRNQSKSMIRQYNMEKNGLPVCGNSGKTSS